MAAQQFVKNPEQPEKTPEADLIKKSGSVVLIILVASSILLRRNRILMKSQLSRSVIIVEQARQARQFENSVQIRQYRDFDCQNCARNGNMNSKNKI
jgi:hypothetical protein